MNHPEELLALYRQQSEKTLKVEGVLRELRLEPPFDYLRLGAQVGGHPGYDVLLSCMWSNADTARGGLGTFRTLARLEDVSESSVLQTVRALLRASLLHELDECLVVGDQRPFYPHKGDPTDQNPFILERDF